MKASLEGVERKFRWADKHFEMLCSEIARAREENPYRITYEPTTDLLGYKFFVHDLAPPDPDLGLIIGDCVHNLRACQDHLAYQLAIRARDELSFPNPFELDSEGGSELRVIAKTTVDRLG